MVSIKDVAKHAGVAISTVSKVLNHYPNISDETRDRVNRAILELNFVPNAVAAALSSKQSGRVAILMNQMTQTQAIDEIDMQYLSGAIHRSKELGLDVITIFFSMLREKSADEIVTYLNSQNIKGLIIYGLSKDDKVMLQLIHMKEFKTVLIDAPIVNDSTSCVWVDQFKAQYDVAAKVISQNEVTSILYIAGKANGFVSEERNRAIRQLGKDMNIKVSVKCGDFSEKEAREITLKYARKYSAVVCASDLMAIGAMKALIDMDIFRPVCGFDGITLMGYVGKHMTTVKQDFYAISSEAVTQLQRLLNGEEGQEVILPHEIVQLHYMDIIC